MIRKIITIDEALCNGCGLCASACHEGAIGIVGGKAKLLREDYCDGLGDCLPACPMGAITFSEREAPAYDHAAVLAAKKAGSAAPAAPVAAPSQLSNFPVQMKLVPPGAPYFEGADLLIAADCAAYAYASFHSDFMRGKITLIGCPKLDATNYAEKLTQILTSSSVRSITVARMTVPCCGGLNYAVQTAIENSGQDIPLHVVIISPDGSITRA